MPTPLTVSRTERLIIQMKALLAVSLAVLALSALAQEGPRTYLPADFAQFAPRTALDMLGRVPGFAIK